MFGAVGHVADAGSSADPFGQMNYGDLFSSAAAANADATTTLELDHQTLHRRAVPMATMTMPEIDRCLRRLRLSGVCATRCKPAWCRPRVPTRPFLGDVLF